MTDDERRKARHQKTSIMKEGGSVYRGMGTAGQIIDESSITKNCKEIFKTSSQVMYGRHYKIIGKFIKRTITTKVILVKMMTQGDMKRNVRKATEKTGG